MHIETFLSAESIAAAATAESAVVAFGHDLPDLPPQLR
jgi:hypothetical protein